MSTPGTRVPQLPPAPHPPAARPATAAARLRAAAVPLLPAAAMSLAGLHGLTARGPWRDEVATYQAAQRDLPQLWDLLRHVDAVHGLYYLLMHAVFRLFGAGEATLRLPSVAAMAVAAAGVALIGRRLAGPAVGLTAGLLLAVTPFASRYAQEGRSYALVTAGVVLSGLLLLRACERPTARRWAGYGAAVLLVGLLHAFALLVLPAHGAALLLPRRPRTSRRVRLGWLAAAAAAALGALPLLLYSSGQAAQVDWLPPVTARTPPALLTDFAGPRPAVLAVVTALAVLGLARPAPRPGGGGPLSLRALALPWLLLPPALLMAASSVTPLYYDRYVLYSLPGLVLSAAAGLDTAARTACRLLSRQAVRTPRPTAVAAALGLLLAAGVLAAQLPVQHRERTARARADDFRAAARLVGQGARPGDAVVFAPANRRGIEDVYPQDFRDTVDALLTVSPAASGTLAGREAATGRIGPLLRRHDRVWLVRGRGRYAVVGARDQEVLRVLAADYLPIADSAVRGFAVQLWTRR
ncbi:glycosyltransferase family 39 protein [Streptomyces sp. NPDC092296]|uniref:glycosyltransferase family 39 protein n=1 Tax=Streptomyces sp. NPDC092296 TaxID=3366012 RepID=UPI00381B450D